MARYIPKSYKEIAEEKALTEEKQKVEKKRRSTQEVAIERTKKRTSLIEYFCKKYQIDITGELVKYIKRIMFRADTKNVPFTAYETNLNLIGESIKILGLDQLTLIVASNATKGYKYLVYDSQLKPTVNKNKAKDNITTHVASASIKTAKISDCEGYRCYLNNESDDKELKRFMKKSFGIEVIE